MRRSRRVATLLFSGTCLVSLAACEEAADLRVYADVQDCMSEQSETVCAQQFAEAREDHAKQAPRYAEKGSCEELYGEGKCVPAEAASGGGQSWFMPAIAGFMLARAMGGPRAQPVYTDRSGYAYVGGRPAGNYQAQARGGTLARSPDAGTSRGGFGQTAGRSSSGSSASSSSSGS